MVKKPATAKRPAAPKKTTVRASTAKAPATRPRAAATRGAKASATPSTVTLKHLAAQLAEEHEMAKRQADAVLSDLVGLVEKHIKRGDRIRIAGHGIHQVRQRAAHMGRNPATGEQIKIKASKKIAFRASKELKEAI